MKPKEAKLLRLFFTAFVCQLHQFLDVWLGQVQENNETVKKMKDTKFGSWD